MSADDAGPLVAGSPEPPAAVHDVALLDLDGVVYLGPEPIPGVADALAGARGAGMRLAFVTNNAGRPPEEVADHLAELGIPARVGDIITSAQAAAAVVARRWGHGARVLPIGGPGVAAALTAAGLAVVRSADEVPVAVVQGLGRDVGWPDLAEAVVAVRNGARHVATNVDPTLPSPRGPLPGNGSLVGVVCGVTGQAPLITGKPDPAMHEECVRRTGARRPLVVGDRLDTDIEGARRAGAASLLVFTGVTDPATLLAAGPQHRPDLLSPDAGGLLVPHPAVERHGGGWRCGSWVAEPAAEGDAVTLRQDGAASQGGDGLDALRALCVAAWSRPPATGARPRVVPGDDAARPVLEAWDLLDRSGGG